MFKSPDPDCYIRNYNPQHWPKEYAVGIVFYKETIKFVFFILFS